MTKTEEFILHENDGCRTRAVSGFLFLGIPDEIAVRRLPWTRGPASLR